MDNKKTLDQINSHLAALDDIKSFLGTYKTTLLGTDFSTLQGILNSATWPQAVDPAMICAQTEADKQERAQNILKLLVTKPLTGLNFLDFGCGEGYVAQQAAAQGANLAIGYDVATSGTLAWNTPTPSDIAASTSSTTTPTDSTTTTTTPTDSSTTTTDSGSTTPTDSSTTTPTDSTTTTPTTNFATAATAGGTFNLTTNWAEIQSNGPYDIIMVYDVMDHLVNNTMSGVLNQIRGVATPTTQIIMRCHPWCGRHGSHLYQSLNKAYVHLVFTPDEITNQLNLTIPQTAHVIYPLKHYRQGIANAGLKIVSESMENTQPVESFFKTNDAIKQRILNNWGRAASAQFPNQQMTTAFVDYVLTF